MAKTQNLTLKTPNLAAVEMNSQLQDIINRTKPTWDTSYYLMVKEIKGAIRSKLIYTKQQILKKYCG